MAVDGVEAASVTVFWWPWGQYKGANNALNASTVCVMCTKPTHVHTSYTEICMFRRWQRHLQGGQHTKLYETCWNRLTVRRCCTLCHIDKLSVAARLSNVPDADLNVWRCSAACRHAVGLDPSVPVSAAGDRSTTSWCSSNGRLTCQKDTARCCVPFCSVTVPTGLVSVNSCANRTLEWQIDDEDDECDDYNNNNMKKEKT
jgi:hypothetical protein